MKISVGGDISIHGSEIVEKLFSEQDARSLFQDVPKAWEESDYVLVNLECAITDMDTKIKKFGPNLKAPYGTAEVLKKIGVTHCCLSNNHIFDFGKAGVKDTLAELDKNQIGYTGYGQDEQKARENLYIEKAGQRIAVICVCEHEYSYALPNREGARAYDPYDTNDDIVEAKKNSDFVVVIYHGGKEHSRYPSPRLLKACRSMVKHGADVVLCQHSHCIGCYENYQGAHILYGQGNFHFVFDAMMDLQSWKEGLLVELDFTDKCTIKFIPTIIEEGGIRLANPVEKKRILDELQERSASIEDGTWRENWAKTCERWPGYKRVILEEKADSFSHYIDCEAHLDVLKQIFQTWNQTNEVD